LVALEERADLIEADPVLAWVSPSFVGSHSTRTLGFYAIDLLSH
jgi:hypothetical protein